MIEISVHSDRPIFRSRAAMTYAQALERVVYDLRQSREGGIVFIVWRNGIPEQAAISPGGGEKSWMEGVK